ncbi:MAG: hypothetical protein QXF25_00250 [Candidatus Pacearchaeota archaeon]
MMSVEILAIVFLAVFFLKIGMLLFDQKKCFKICKNVLEHEVVMTVLSLLAVLLVSYFLFQEMSQVEVAAAAVFIMLLEAVTFFTHSHYEDMKELKQKMMASKNLLKRNWFAAVLWTLFALWVILRLVS